MDGRRSSVFDVCRTQQDRGSSKLCISDRPSQIKKGPRVQYENTYKLEPDTRFDVKRIQAIVDDVLLEKFSGIKYNAVEMGHLCKRTSQAIRDAIKLLQCTRHKIVVVVNVTQNMGQGVKVASRFLWDDRKDNWVRTAYTNSSLRAEASVFGLYFE